MLGSSWLLQIAVRRLVIGVDNSRCGRNGPLTVYIQYSHLDGHIQLIRPTDEMLQARRVWMGNFSSFRDV